MAARLVAGFFGLFLLAAALPASAGHHQWFISELYSNADGTVQFVELLGTADNEAGVSGFSVTTAGSTPTSAPLAPNLPSNLTNGAYMLLGTAGYATLAAAQGAPAPDRTLPDNFLETVTADAVTYAGIGSTTRSYAAGGLPTDGVLSLDYEVGSPGTTANTPQNFAGATGSINGGSAPVPMMSRLGIILLIGALVLGISWRLRRREARA